MMTLKRYLAEDTFQQVQSLNCFESPHLEEQNLLQEKKQSGFVFWGVLFVWVLFWFCTEGLNLVVWKWKWDSCSRLY